MKVLSTLIAKAAFSSAKRASGSASQWLQYQPKEPVNLKKMLKNHR